MSYTIDPNAQRTVQYNEHPSNTPSKGRFPGWKYSRSYVASLRSSIKTVLSPLVSFLRLGMLYTPSSLSIMWTAEGRRLSEMLHLESRSRGQIDCTGDERWCATRNVDYLIQKDKGLGVIHCRARPNSNL